MEPRIKKNISQCCDIYEYQILHFRVVDISKYQNTLKISIVVGNQGWKRIIVVVVTIITIFEAPDYRYD